MLWHLAVALIKSTQPAKCGAIAQLGERIVRNDEVVGSIPTSSTNFAFRWLIHKTRSLEILTRVSLASALACQDVRP
jgi:hypothetical protein